jgi:hypothetical protein
MCIDKTHGSAVVLVLYSPFIDTQNHHQTHSPMRTFSAIVAMQHFSERNQMFKNTPVESAVKTMMAGSEKFNPAAAQEALKPVMDNLKAWADLAQQQAAAAQAAVAEAMEAAKSIKEPQDAFEAMKASAENAMEMAAKNVKDATALSVAQFNSTVDSLEKNSPAPEAFASVAKGMKDAASSMENAVEMALKKGADAVASASPGAAAKKSRKA